MYLLGCFCSYFILRADMRVINQKTDSVYTVSDRVLCIALSSSSWIGAAAGCIIYVIQLPKNNTPANW